jgi:thioester reductase-like protein
MLAGHTPAEASGEDGVLLTGATGFVGKELLAWYLERTDRPIYTLVRAADEDAASERLRDSMRSLFGRDDAYSERVIPVAGDIERVNLGLDHRGGDILAERITDIVHAAASVSFTLPLEQAREINVEGTRRLLDFAGQCERRGGLRRFSYLSTAYVAGTATGEFAEDQLEVGQEFRNTYEQSKFEAERLVRSYREGLPIQIFRPSIVVGERASGWTSSFNVLYSPLKAFSRGAYTAVPGRRSAPVDAVPVDYVAEAVYELSRRPEGAGETYHLVAGGQATTVGQLVELGARAFHRPPPPMLPPKVFRWLYPLLRRTTGGRRRRALESTEVFFPYFSMDVRYDNRRARSRLEPVGITVPPVERYFGRLVEFAVRSRWGRRPLSRVEARGGRVQ